MVGLVGIMGLVIIAAGVMGDALLRKQASRLMSLKLDTQVIEAQQASLDQAKKDLEKYNELEAIAKKIVPQDKDQARATREIINLANQSGIKIASVGFPASNLGVKPPAAPKTDDSSKTSSADTPKPAEPTAPPITQVKPVDGIKNLYQLDIIIISDTSSPTTYPRLIDFLSRLEQNRRTAQVSQISIQPDGVNRNSLNFTLTITVYTKP